MGVTKTQAAELSKSQRVAVRTLNGIEYGTVDSWTRGADHPQVTVHFDDDTYCTFPRSAVTVVAD